MLVFVPSSEDGCLTDVMQNAELLAKIMGGPSDAELMKASMATIVSPSDSLEDKLTAFDNFEQLIESLDNANLLATLNLWDPLFAQLKSPESQLRFFAAWCIGTATQNNAPAQESVLKIGGIPTLVRVALEDADAGVRKKAAYALSSEIRNYQPGIDEFIKAIPEDVRGAGQQTFDAADMTCVDGLMERLRARPTATVANPTIA